MNIQTLKKAKTLTGLTMEQVLEKMREKLPDAAYSDLPGRSSLTSINPHYTLEMLTNVFGPFGIGFGLDWEPENLFTVKEERQKSDGSGSYIRWVACLDQIIFWFRLDDGSDDEILISYPISSGAENEDRSYAIRGARTNALQDGATKLLYQIELFKEQKRGNNSRPQSTGAPIADPGSVVVPFDKAKELFGGTAPTIDALYQEDPGFVEWICNKIEGDVGNAARQYIQQLSGGKPIPQLSANGGLPTNMVELMAFAKSKGHTFANPGALYGFLQEQLGWKAVPKPDDTGMWEVAASLFDGEREGDAASEPFQPEGAPETS